MRERVRRACVTAMLLCASCSEPDDVEPPPWAAPLTEATPRERCVPATENAWMDVRQRSEPRPLVISWEEGRTATPSFVLFDDASFLWEPFTRGEPLRRGTLEAEERDAVHHAFLEAGLEDEPPIQSLVDHSIDHNVATHCVRRGERWICAALEGAALRRESLNPARAHREASTSSDARPTPEAFRAVQAQIDTFAGRPSAPLERTAQLLEIDKWRGDSASAQPWPPELPPLPPSPPPATLSIPIARLEQVQTHLAATRGRVLHRGRPVEVWVNGRAHPGWREVRAVSDAFRSLRCGRP